MDPDEVRNRWVDRHGEFSPTYYAHLGPNATSESLREVFDDRLGRDASILELGCNAGRHLAYLMESGYDDLSGVDINGDAFEKMAETFPNLSDRGRFYEAAIQAVLPTFEAGQFEAVYSVETLQHVHPDDDWVFDELARITADLLVTVETEQADRDDEGIIWPDDGPPRKYIDDDFPLFYRNWRDVLEPSGFEQIGMQPALRGVLRAFRPPGDRSVGE